MNALARWLVLAILAFGGLAGGYHAHLTSHPKKVLVLIDTSYEMRPALTRIPAALKRLEGRRYTRYALETDKAPIHGYDERLNPGRIDAYAPRDFTRLVQAKDGAFAEADEIVLISNAPAAALKDLPGWRVVRP